MNNHHPTHRQLMCMHVEALYTSDANARLLSVNQWDGGTAPRFFLGRTVAGNVWRFRTDLPDELIHEVEKLCHAESSASWVTELSPLPAYHSEFVHILSAHQPIENSWAGPAYWFSTEHSPTFCNETSPAIQPTQINESNADLLRGGFEDWLADVPHRQPFMAIVEDGRAVSLCASVRITDAAHEPGVETLLAYRQRGHAVNVVSGWAKEVQKVGAIPLYSTSWENHASQNVANRLGLTMFGVDFHII